MHTLTYVGFVPSISREADYAPHPTSSLGSSLSLSLGWSFHGNTISTRLRVGSCCEASEARGEPFTCCATFWRATRSCDKKPPSENEQPRLAASTASHDFLITRHFYCYWNWVAPSIPHHHGLTPVYDSGDFSPHHTVSATSATLKQADRPYRRSRGRERKQEHGFRRARHRAAAAQRGVQDQRASEPGSEGDMQGVQFPRLGHQGHLAAQVYYE